MNNSKPNPRDFTGFLNDLRHLRASATLRLGDCVLSMKRDDAEEASSGSVVWLILECETPRKRSVTVLLEDESREMTSDTLAEQIAWLTETLG